MSAPLPVAAAVPYFRPADGRFLPPDADGARWLVLNPDSGPGAGRDPVLAEAARRAREAGARVLGYVATGYARRPWAEVLDEAARYERDYPVDGIFLDEVCEGPSGLEHYARLAARLRPRGLLALNPGTACAAAYFPLADVVVTFEGPLAAHEALPLPPGPLPPRPEVWHLVYDVPAARLESTVRRSLAHGAGVVFVTDLAGANPYAALPSYWADEVGLLARLAKDLRPAPPDLGPALPASGPAPPG